jgi:hypothetical protein
MYFENAIAEESVVQTILEGSGPADEMTERGLRFIRYLLSMSRSARHGFIPNFTDTEMVRRAARDFIVRHGGPALAMQSLREIVACDS